MNTYTVITSPVGPLTLTASDGRLTGIHWDGSAQADAGVRDDRIDGGFAAARTQLAEYFAGERTTFDLPLDPQGSDFQRRVWAALAEIPFGQTRSYTQVATAIGRPDRVRAAAAANGRNPLPIVIPCHRVVGADGSLTGFAGGLARKRFLLDLERPAAQAALF